MTWQACFSSHDLSDSHLPDTRHSEGAFFPMGPTQCVRGPHFSNIVFLYPWILVDEPANAYLLRYIHGKSCSIVHHICTLMVERSKMM